MKLKINLRNGSVVDMEVPDGTHFQATCVHIKAAGYLLSDTLFVPLDWIASIHIDGPQVVQKLVIPGTETRQ